MDDGFAYHKFCVVTVAGTLLVHDAGSDTPALYLRDGGDPRETDAPPDPGPDDIEVTDAGLIDFVCRNASSARRPVGSCLLSAQLTGTVSVDHDRSYFSTVSHATLQDGSRQLQYDAGG